MEDKQKRNKRILEWQQQNKDRIVLLLEKCDGAEIRQAAKESGKSITQYVMDKIKQPP